MGQSTHVISVGTGRAAFLLQSLSAAGILSSTGSFLTLDDLVFDFARGGHFAAECCEGKWKKVVRFLKMRSVPKRDFAEICECAPHTQPALESASSPSS